MELITHSWKKLYHLYINSSNLLVTLLFLNARNEINVLFGLLLDQLVVVAMGKVVLDAEETTYYRTDAQPDADGYDLGG